MRESIKAFVQGLITPSVPSVAIALAILVGALGLFAWRVSPEWYANGGYAYFMKDGTSFDAYVTGRALKLKEGNLDLPAVVLIGGSVTCAATPHEDVFAATIAGDLGSEVAVFKLCANALTSWQMAALANQIPDDFSGIVVIGIGMNRVSRSTDYLADLIKRPRLGFVSPLIDEEARLAGIDVPVRTGNYLIDNRGFLLARTNRFLYHLVVGPVSGPVSPYSEGEVQSRADLEANVSLIRGIRKGYDDYSEMNYEVLSRMIARLRQRGVTPVFLKPPINQQFLSEHLDPETYEERWGRTSFILDSLGVPLWDFQEAAALSDTDFYDWAHLSDQDAIDRYTRILSKRISEYLASTQPELQ